MRAVCRQCHKKTSKIFGSKQWTQELVTFTNSEQTMPPRTSLSTVFIFSYVDFIEAWVYLSPE